MKRYFIVKGYLDQYLKKLKVKTKRGEFILDLVLRYYKDSEYYLDKDYDVALEAISYASGLLDCAVITRDIEIEEHYFNEIKENQQQYQ